MIIENYFDEQGSGSPIVFIHGSFATTSTWKKMVEHLAIDQHCISIKLPGHCGTPAPEDFTDPTIETELGILEKIVSLLTDEPVHLVGHSFGGVVALAQALKGNLDINQVTLFEPVTVSILDELQDDVMSAIVQSFLAQYRLDASKNIPYACGQVIDFWGGEGVFDSLPWSIKDSMVPLVENNIRHWDAEAAFEYKLGDIQKLSIPTRIVYGTASSPVSHAICEHLYKHIPQSKKYTIKGASHFLVTSHVTDCLEALTDQSILN